MTTEQKEIEREFWLSLAKRERETIEQMDADADLWEQEDRLHKYGELTRKEVAIHEAMEVRYLLNAQV